MRVDAGAVFLLVLLALAAWQDFRSHRICNLLTGGGVVLGFGYRTLILGDGGAVGSLLGLATGLAVFLPFYRLRAMGAGDVKLMAMVGAWLGPVDALGAALGAFLAGGAMAVVYVMKFGGAGRLLSNVWRMTKRGAARRAPGREAAPWGVPDSVGELPYAVAIALGTAGFLIWK